MANERIFCTVKNGFTEIVIDGKGEIEHLSLPSPCRGCQKRSEQDAAVKIEALSDSYFIDVSTKGSLNVTVALHEDNPSVPVEVKVGEPIVLSCAYDF